MWFKKASYVQAGCFVLFYVHSCREVKFPRSTDAKSSGAPFDPTLSFDCTLKKSPRSHFFHLRNIKLKIWCCPSLAHAVTLIHGFFHSDSRHSLLYLSLLASHESLQMAQNAAARNVTNTRKCDCITPILASRHLLPVHIRYDFRGLLMA